METMLELVRPDTYIEGRDYLWLERRENGSHQPLVLVKFLKYDSCPVFVIVLKESGQRIRCLREELFLQG